ncbi:MAG: hypothetical protein AAGA99_21235 [Actinomycetota bacterium]
MKVALGEEILAEVGALIAEVAPHPHTFELDARGVPCLVVRTNPCGTGRIILGHQYAICGACAEAIAKALSLSPAFRSVASPTYDVDDWIATVTGRSR